MTGHELLEHLIDKGDLDAEVEVRMEIPDILTDRRETNGYISMGLQSTCIVAASTEHLIFFLTGR